jgi:hypothetical protein
MIRQTTPNMPAIRQTSMSSIKPVKTERTHEENQERAYIAASRRSDRSLEARVESARRASEIHKRRTGRSLRVTEQDVSNEEMYEEEDDDLPMQYRRLTAHLQTQNDAFNRRFHSYLVNQVATRQNYGAAMAAAQWNGNQFQPFPQTMNPGLMQIPPSAFQGNMQPPQMYHTSPANYRQQPYPTTQGNAQAIRQAYHGRSASIPTPQPMPQYQQVSHSAQASPVEARPMTDRRMSLPAQTAMPQTPMSQQGLVQSPTHVSPSISRAGSSTNLTTQSQVKAESPQQMPSPAESQHTASQRPQPLRQISTTSPLSPMFDSQFATGIDPISMQLPMEAQQALLGASPSTYQMTNQMFTQPSYSYNPNGKPRSGSMQQGPGLNQTLMPSALDTTLTGFDPSSTMAPSSAIEPGFAFTPQTPLGFGFGFNSDLNQDLMKGSADGLDISGQVTPHDEGWMNFLNENSSQEDLFKT